MAGRKKQSKGKKKNATGMQRSKVSAPVASGKVLKRAGEPRMRYRAGGDVVIEHEELAVEAQFAFSANTFNAVSYNLNPGNSTLFPWLSTVAPSWETYLFESLEVSYMSLVPTSTGGGYYMAVDYDATDEIPNDRRQLMAYRDAVRADVWVPEVKMVCRKEDLQKRKSYYISTSINVGAAGQFDFNTQGEAGDDRLNDVGQLIIATDNNASTGTIVGEILLRYKVRLSTPQLSSALNPKFFSMQSNDTYGTGITASLPFGTTAPQNSAGIQVIGFPASWNSGLPIKVNPAAAISTFYTYQPGSYYVTLQFQVATSLLSPSLGTDTGSTLNATFTGVSSTSYIATFYWTTGTGVRPTGPMGNYGFISISFGTYSGLPRNAYIRVSPAPYYQASSGPGPQLTPVDLLSRRRPISSFSTFRSEEEPCLLKGPSEDNEVKTTPESERNQSFVTTEVDGQISSGYSDFVSTLAHHHLYYTGRGLPMPCQHGLSTLECCVMGSEGARHLLVKCPRCDSSREIPWNLVKATCCSITQTKE